MPTFRSLHNPDFKLSSPKLSRLIVFEKGRFTTDDPQEVRELRRAQGVEEVSGEAPRKQPPSTARASGGEVRPFAPAGSARSEAKGPVGSPITSKGPVDDEYGS